MAEKKLCVPIKTTEKKSDPQTGLAKEKLKQCKDTIVRTKPTSSDKEYVDRVLDPSDQKDWKIIRYYKRINLDVKTEFRKNETRYGVTSWGGRGKRGKGNTVGQNWDKELSKIFQASYKPEDETQDDTEAKLPLLRNKLSELFKIEFLDSHFLLHGYMCSTMGKCPKVYLWVGEADSVGWYTDSSGNGRYVIVDWKVLDILDFWEKNPNAYGKFLHQCLVYARLLQLHLKLDYLPHILIVPISGVTGQDMHPALFCDYPEMCKDLIKSFEWSNTLPEPPKKISGTSALLKPSLPVGKIDENMPLTALFNKDAKVSHLLEEFGWHSLEVTADEIKNE